jgi:hypothetical protein
MTLLELAERCEKATGPDDALDWAAAEAIGCAPGLPYSASLDAAMTLVPDGYEWGCGSWGNPDTDGPWAWCATRQQSADNDLDYGKAATPALALCAAALKARAAECVPNTPEGDG